MKRFRFAATLIGLAFASAIAATARADDGDKRDPAAAEALWREGRSLRAAGKIAEACPKFEASYKLDPALGALLNLASCHELEGRIATAWSEYSDAADQAKKVGDKKRVEFAKKHADALEPRVPHLELHAPKPAPEGLLVTRDGQPLGPGALGTSLPTDPGVHTLEAHAPGHVGWRRKIELLAGERQTVDVPQLAKDATPDAAPIAVATMAKTPDTEAPPPPTSNSARTAGFVLGGVGLAGLAVGATFGILTGSATSDAKVHCPNNGCSPQGLDDVSRGKTFAWVSDIGFIGGGAALVAGTVLLVTSRKKARSTSGLVLAPLASPSGAGLSARGSF
jgi:hypothetical protein